MRPRLLQMSTYSIILKEMNDWQDRLKSLSIPIEVSYKNVIKIRVQVKQVKAKSSIKHSLVFENPMCVTSEHSLTS